MQSNIRIYYLYKFFGGMGFWLPILTIFFLVQGLNLTQVMTIVAVQSLFQILFEVPSGIFSDFYGRKTTLIISMVLSVIGILFYAYGGGFILYLLGGAILGMSVAFESGSDSSFIYDTLKTLKREAEYKSIEGRAYAYELAGLGIAGFIGGFLTKINFTIPFIFTAIAFIIGLIILFFAKEPQKYSESEEKNYFKHLVGAARFSWKHPSIKWLMIFYSSMIAAMLISHRFFQPYMSLVGIDTTYFGVVYLVLLIGCALSAHYAHKIEEKFGSILSVLLIPFVVGVPLIVLGATIAPFALIVLLFAEFAFGFTKPIVYGYINRHVGSHNRATILSLAGFLQSILLMVFAPIFGYFADLLSLQTALLIEGALALLLGILFGILVIRTDNVAT